MKSLMIHVERAVRPVRAHFVTKMRMREELYAHLNDIFQEEKHRQKDESVAAQSACRRMGNPAEMTATLQASVPASEAIFWYADQFLQRRPQESALRFAGRTTPYMLALFVAVAALAILLVIPVTSLVRPGGFPVENWPHLGRALLGLLLMVTLNTFVFTLMARSMQQQMSGPTLRPQSWRVGLLLAGITTASIFLTTTLLLMIIGGGLSGASSTLTRTIVLAGMAPVMCAAVSRLSATEQKQASLWTSLDLDAENASPAIS